MLRFFAHTISPALAIAMLLCLNACGNSKYWTIENGVATVASLEHIADSRARGGVYADIARELEKTEEPFHTLVLDGDMVVSVLHDFAPVADKITNLIIRGKCGPPYNLSEYRNLKRLQILSLSLIKADEIEKFLDALRACISLRELSILEPKGRDYYAFSKSIKTDRLLTTVNGQALDDWNPANDLKDSESKYYYTIDVLSESFESELTSYTTSAKTPPVIRGKIIIGTQEDSNPIEFREIPNWGTGSEALGKDYYAPTLNECVAVIILRRRYELYGTYADGTKGYRGHFSVQVIDPVNKIIYKPVPLTSIDPSQRIERGSNGSLVSGRPRPDVDRTEFRAYLKKIVTPER